MPDDLQAWFPPSDPRPPADSPFARALAAMGEALAAGDPVAVPPFAGIGSRIVVRWLYRALLAGRRGWVPLVCIDPRRVEHPREVLLESLDEAAGGWLWLEAGWERVWKQATVEQGARNRRTRLLFAAAAEEVPVEPATARRLEQLDGFHMVASDPSIDRLRRAALAHCRADGLLYFSGPPGTGKRSLARWAHARLDDGRPLRWVRAGNQGHIGHGGWSLYEELGQLTAAQLEPLREQLQGDNRHVSPREPDEEVPPRPDAPGLDAIVGESPALRRVLAKAARYARSRLPILIRGESGCGKELLAEAVHTLSGRRGRFVAIDLSAKNANLVESELFGHVPGAFTGARTARKGALIEADGGTIFLDELGNLSFATQAKLLRFLESRKIQPVGSDKSQAVDVRVIAATNADLEDMVCDGSFRRDLLYRFNPNAALVLPPLRERVEDVVPLARTFVARAVDGTPPRIDPEAAAILEGWSWPGNIRELRHVVESAVVEAGGGDIGASALRGLIDATQGAAPLIATSSDSEALAAHCALLPGELRQLTAISLRFPTLAERGPNAVRNAVLAQLDGRPIRRVALRALERYSWWGNLFELRSCMDALKANQPGEVDLSAVQDQLPELLAGESRAPIRVLLFPAVLPGGVVRGLEQSFSEPALMVGRAAHLDELRPDDELGGAAGRRLRRRWSLISTIIGDIEPAFLPVDFLAKLSRAHLILTREQSGLCVNVLPGVFLRTLAGPLSNNELFEIEPGGSADVGEAGEVVILDEDGEHPYLRFFVFVGEIASHDWADRLGRRMTGTPNERTVGAPKDGARTWMLNAKERRALGDLVIESLTSPRPFATSLREGSAHWARTGRTELWKLAECIDSAHPTQSCARLVAFTENEVFRRELGSRLKRLEDPGEAWGKLPTRLRRAVPRPDS